jgi:hypothetical protein
MYLQRRVARFALIALLTLGLSACGGGARISMNGQTIRVHADHIWIRDRGGDTAEIKANGALRIAGKPMALTPAQRVLTTRLFTQVQIAMYDGKQTGWAGAHLAGSVIGSLFSALFHDDSRIINHTAHAQTANLDRHVDRLCTAIGAIRTTQDQLVAQLPAFAPYASISAHALKNCSTSARNR